MPTKHLNIFGFDSNGFSFIVNPDTYIQIIDEQFWDMCNVECSSSAKLFYIRSNNFLTDLSDDNISRVLNMKQSNKKYFYTIGNL